LTYLEYRTDSERQDYAFVETRSTIYIGSGKKQDRHPVDIVSDRFNTLQLGFDGVVFVPEEESYGSLKPGFEVH